MKKSGYRLSAALLTLAAMVFLVAGALLVPGLAAATPGDPADPAAEAATATHDGAVMPLRQRRHSVPRISENDSDDLGLQSVDLPASFDLRNVDGVSYVTPVRNQNPYGTCWAFSFCAAAESNYLMKTGQAIQLSPLQVAYYTYNTPQTPRPGLEGDFNYLTDDGDCGFDTGGDEYTTGFSAMSWTGLVDESILPYSLLTEEYYGHGYYYDDMPFTAYWEEDFPDEYAYSRNTYQVHEVSYVNLADRDAVKAQLMEQGAAVISYYDNSRFYYRASDGTYSYYQGVRDDGWANHAVTLVGWDDDFYSFKSSNSPSGPGAWLIKNSWGDTWGQSGYFWLSYYDASLDDSAVTFIDLEPVDPNETIFQYDGNSSWVTSYNRGSLDCANVFTSQTMVQLDQVACYLYGTGINYQVQVYTDIQDSDDPTSGTPAFDQPPSGTFGGEAYLNVTLPQTVAVRAGESFSVVFSLTGARIEVGSDCSVGPDDVPSDYNYVFATGHAEPGQSFLLYDGYSRWFDVSDDEDEPFNLRIKAYGDACEPVAEVDLNQVELAAVPAQVYAARELEPGVTMSYGGTTLVEGQDYRLSYADNVDVGDATITITGTAGTSGSGNYVGTRTVGFSIVERDIEECCAWEPIDTQYYRGGALTPDILLYWWEDADEEGAGGAGGSGETHIITLVKGRDYTLAYSDNDRPGMATVTITGINNYTGTLEDTFEIIQAVKELAGTNRYETAALIARETYPEGAAGAIVATGKDFPDALGAAGLAGMLDWPILLTEPGNLHQATYDAIVDLGIGEVIVVGGTGAVSDKVEQQLQGLVGGETAVTRVAGANRYKTAEAVYTEGCRRGFWGDTAIISTGKNYPDALSISGYAFSEVAPIFLCDPSAGLTAETKAALSDGGFSRVIIVGGTGVVPTSVENWVSDNVTGNVQRLAGGNRYDTSKKIAEFVLENGGSANGACIATGANFPDALAGGVLVGRTGSILLLADPSNTIALDVLRLNAAAVNHLYYLGGIGAVPQSVRDAAEAAAGLR